MHLMDSNPDGPAHWMAGYIREVEKRKGYARRVHIRENVHLDPEYISYVESIYTLAPSTEQGTLMESSLLARASFISTCQKADGAKGGRVAVAADAGAAGVTAALYAREQRDGTWVVFDEYYPRRPNSGPNRRRGPRRRHNRAAWHPRCLRGGRPKSEARDGDAGRVGIAPRQDRTRRRTSVTWTPAFGAVV